MSYIICHKGNTKVEIKGDGKITTVFSLPSPPKKILHLTFTYFSWGYFCCSIYLLNPCMLLFLLPTVVISFTFVIKLEIFFIDLRGKNKYSRITGLILLGTSVTFIFNKKGTKLKKTSCAGMDYSL